MNRIRFIITYCHDIRDHAVHKMLIGNNTQQSNFLLDAVSDTDLTKLVFINFALEF